MIATLLNSLSTREIAALLWIVVIIPLLLTKKSIRNSFGNVIKALLKLKLYITLLICYSAFLVFLLYLIGFWQTYLLKDTIIWFFGFAGILFLRLPNATNFRYFGQVVLDVVKLTFIVEFMLNFYTFKLWIELILFTIFVLLVILQVFSKSKPEHQAANNLLTNLLAIFGFIVLGYTIFQTIIDYSQLLTLETLKSLLLPVILSLLILPFFYSLALYIRYEELFVRVRFMTNDQNQRRQLCRAIFRVAHFNINRVARVHKNLKKPDIQDCKDYQKLIKQVCK